MLLQFSRLAHVDQQADPCCQNLFIEPFTSSSSVGALEHMTEDTWTGTILSAARPHVDWRDVRVTVRSIPFSEEGFDKFRTTARLDACEVAFHVAWPDPAQDDAAPASKRRRNVDVDWLQRSRPAKEPGPGANSHSSSLEAELEAILDEDALNHFRDLRELVREAVQVDEGATSGEEELGLPDAQHEDEQEGEEEHGEIGVVVVDGQQVEVIDSLDAELERVEARVFRLFLVCSLRWVGKAIATHRLYCRCE